MVLRWCERRAHGRHVGGKRVTARIICTKMEVEDKLLNVVSAYAPQVECDREIKRRSVRRWTNLWKGFLEMRS